MSRHITLMPRAGFEPAASALGERRSIQLSYRGRGRIITQGVWPWVGPNVSPVSAHVPLCLSKTALQSRFGSRAGIAPLTNLAWEGRILSASSDREQWEQCQSPTLVADSRVDATPTQALPCIPPIHGRVLVVWSDFAVGGGPLAAPRIASECQLSETLPFRLTGNL